MTRPALPVDLPAFDAALVGDGATLLDCDGGAADLPVRRWNGPADADDDWLLDRCTGPTVDLGCGPGRLLVGLARRGVAALGVDHSPVAQQQCGARGVVMLRRDVFARVPGEGRWAHVLLAVGGTVLVETDPEPERDWRGVVRVHTAGGAGPSTRWARVGAAALGRLGATLGLAVVAQRPGSRAFVALRR